METVAYGHSGETQVRHRSARLGGLGLLHSGGEMQRHLRRLPTANQYSLHPVGEHAVIAGPQVVLSDRKPIEFEVSVGVCMGCVRMQAVGGLDDHCRVSNGVP